MLNIIENNLVLDCNVKSQKELFELIAKVVFNLKRAKSKLAVYKALMNREKQISTALEKGLAIPHFQDDAIQTVTTVVVRNKTPLDDYLGLDGSKVKLAVAILCPKSAKKDHLQILGKISSLFLDRKMIDFFLNKKPSQIVKQINKVAKGVLGKETKSKKVQLGDKKIDSSKKTVVAVTSCIAGIAHTMMAADAIKKYCTENNFNVFVETQGSLSDKLTLKKEQIDAADVVIISADKVVEGMDRFLGKRLYSTSTNASIKDASKVVKTAFQNQSLYGTKKQTARNSAKIKIDKTPLPNSEDKKEHHHGKHGAVNIFAPAKNRNFFLKHMLNGVSYMIPFIVLAGITLALALGIFGKISDGKLAPVGFGVILNTIATQGFNLYIPILSGFIAYSIVGRAGLVPAMVTGWLIGNGTELLNSNGEAVSGLSTIWNWGSMDFGYKDVFGANFTGGFKIGFLGAIGTGFVSGYVTKIFTDVIKWNRYIAPIIPILIIPIFATFITWAIFSFALAIPFIYLSAGLYKLLQILQDNNLFWILALMLGLMIAFDMGGPVNKIAFTFGAGLISVDPAVMGVVAIAIGIPPIGMALASFIGYKLRAFEQADLNLGVAGIILGFFGITEGAIPFAIKYPKTVFAANMVGAAAGAVVGSFFFVSDVAAHGSVIVYILGAVGKNGISNYVYGLWYLMAIAIGAGVTAAVAILGNLFVYRIKKEVIEEKKFQIKSLAKPIKRMAVTK